jgi:hypothetical protein
MFDEEEREDPNDWRRMELGRPQPSTRDRRDAPVPQSSLRGLLCLPCSILMRISITARLSKKARRPGAAGDRLAANNSQKPFQILVGN